MYSGQKNNQIKSIFKEELLTFLHKQRETAHSFLMNGGEIALNEFCLIQKLILFVEENYPDYPEVPYFVKTIDNLGTLCPTQWEGETKCGKKFYCRYRGGVFSLDVDNKTIYRIQLENDPEITVEEYLKKDNPFNYSLEDRKRHWETEIFYRRINGGRHSYGGILSNQEMINATKGFLDFSQSFTNF